jgi:hypothetical protein
MHNKSGNLMLEFYKDQFIKNKVMEADRKWNELYDYIEV